MTLLAPGQQPRYGYHWENSHPLSRLTFPGCGCQQIAYFCRGEMLTALILLTHNRFLVVWRGMKTLLAILLSFIITEAPVLAIHGGYTLGGTGQIDGTYAGVFVPTGDIFLSSTTGAETGSSAGTNDLGLFTLNVPSTGVSTGNLVIFSAGRTFTGTIQGIPDPNNTNGLQGLITATYDFNVYVTNTTITNGVVTETVSTVPVTATAQGSFTAETSTSTASIQSPTGVLLTGQSSLQIDDGLVNDDGSPLITEVASFDIEGFQQSASFSTGAETF